MKNFLCDYCNYYNQYVLLLTLYLCFLSLLLKVWHITVKQCMCICVCVCKNNYCNILFKQNCNQLYDYISNLMELWERIHFPLVCLQRYLIIALAIQIYEQNEKILWQHSHQRTVCLNFNLILWSIYKVKFEGITLCGASTKFVNFGMYMLT